MNQSERNWESLRPGTVLRLRVSGEMRYVTEGGRVQDVDGNPTGYVVGIPGTALSQVYDIVMEPGGDVPGDAIPGVLLGSGTPAFKAGPPARLVAPGAWLASLSSDERKECAVARGLFSYFPDAVALVARHSVRMNEKHNPGEPVHWARGKSADQPDCEARHLIATSLDPAARDADGAYEIVSKAWRALADLQEWAEKQYAKDGKIE